MPQVNEFSWIFSSLLMFFAYFIFLLFLNFSSYFYFVKYNSKFFLKFSDL